jgi:Zn-finger nucleic acid-binding protein
MFLSPGRGFLPWGEKVLLTYSHSFLNVEVPMRCPRCEADLKKVLVNTIELDTCASCEGVWFDHGELRAVLDMDKNEVAYSAIAHTMETEVDYQEVPGRSEMQCPRCNGDMQRYSYQGYSGILLDSCENNCGIWLDDGELQKLFNYMYTASKPDPQKEAYLKAELTQIRVDAEQKERALIDSLVMMDNRPGFLKLPGMVLQGVYSLFNKLGM